MDKPTQELSVEQPFVIVTLILAENLRQKFANIVKAKDVCGGTIVRGKGTVTSAVLNLLGIKSQKKEIISFLLQEEKAEGALDYFTKEFQLHEPGHGIVFTTPVMTARQVINKNQDAWDRARSAEEKSMFKKLTVVVNRGMAPDVMDIAYKSGVNGGTIVHGRGTAENAAKVFGIEIEPEKELVIILMPSGLVDKVVNDISQELQLEVPGNGILFVEPILDVRGLFESHRNNNNNNNQDAKTEDADKDDKDDAGVETE